MLVHPGVLVQADALANPFPDNYFHSVITSPPYWGLRAYAGDQGEEPFGMEETPERHIERMVKVARGVWRVLRPDGVFWLNYGDTYAASPAGNLGDRQPFDGGAYKANKPFAITSVDQGNLMMMPHRVAIALQNDGWMLRNDLVWFKSNPTPEPRVGWRWERHRIKVRSADVDWREEARRTDRPLEGPAHVGGGNTGFRYSPEWENCEGCEKCEPNDGYILRKGSWRHTRAHEYVFQFVKGMKYYCNSEAVREPYTEPLDRWGGEARSLDDHFKGDDENRMRGLHRDRDIRPNPAGRNPRSVLEVPTAPYKGAHYATFPPNLIAPMIKASVPARCCPECGDPYAPIVERHKHPTRDVETQRKESVEATGRTDGFTMGPSGMVDQTSVTGYKPTCEHEGDPIPGIVLDIFGGSGTTGMVAKSLMRRWAVMDISRPYLDEQAKLRTGQGMPSKALDDLPLFGGMDGGGE